MGDFLAILLREDFQLNHDKLNEKGQEIEKINCYKLDFSEVLMDKDIFIGTKERNPESFSFKDDRYDIVFHGKIHNQADLKTDLERMNYHFETELVEEVIVKLFHEKGVGSFAKLQGLFSILIWDKYEETLYGARDRFGVKPLYYQEVEEGTTFTTDKNNLLLANDFHQVNMDALQLYLTYQYVPEPMTITKGVFRVQPGYYFIKKANKPIHFHQYFHACFQSVITEKSQLMDKVRESLIKSVEKNVKNEKSLGSFLSGGIDSSLIATIAKEYHPNIKTFSVGFSVDGFSELDEAEQTAELLGLENTSYVITPQEFTKVLPEIMMHLDDPFADPSCIPLYIAAREAKKHVTTVLSGEGADELFGGYNIYREYKSLKMFKFLPEQINHVLYKLSILFPEGMKGKSFLERGTTPLKDRYIGNAKLFEEDEKKALLKSYNQETAYQTITQNLFEHVMDEHPVHQMQYIDIHTWLPGNILLKAHTMTKAHALGLCLPFLDNEVYQVAKAIPVHDKIAKGTTKLILREAFQGDIPKEILQRKKLGFPVPIAQWLKQDLYEWAQQLIDVSETDSMINKDHVRHLLDKHALNQQDYGRKIWTVLMFMLWHQVHMEGTHEFK